MIPRCPKTCRNITPYPHKKEGHYALLLVLNDLRVCAFVQRCNFCTCVEILKQFVDNVFRVFHGLKGIKKGVISHSLDCYLLSLSFCRFWCSSKNLAHSSRVIVFLS